MGAPAVPTDELQRTADTFRETINISETARRLDLDRRTVRRRLRAATEAGMIEEGEWSRDPNTPTSEQYLSAKERKLKAFAKKKAKGDWRKPVLTTLPGKPFRLKLFGDPHLDADGCNFELFEKHFMDLGPGTYGIWIGDAFNNWLKALSHLWKGEGDPSDAWLLFEHLMAERGEWLIGGCSGNHDDWTHGPTDPVSEIMRKYGVRYRKGAIRLMVQCGDYAPMFWSIRHKWRGRSIYSPAHWGARAVHDGWHGDLLMVGGHIHVDDPRMIVRDDCITHVCQISAFKEFDEFVDVHGFNGPKISPVWDLVIDPSRPDNDADKVKVFWDSTRAAAYLDAIS